MFDLLADGNANPLLLIGAQPKHLHAHSRWFPEPYRRRFDSSNRQHRCSICGPPNRDGKSSFKSGYSAAAIGGSFVFAAQMLNYPIPGGTSGHLIGAALMAIFLGPSAAILVLTSVLLVQSLAFGDGGISALGANILNMGIIASLVGFFVFRGAQRLFGTRNVWTTSIAVALAAWISTVASAACCALELAASRTIPLAIVLPAMVEVHTIIGLGEALISVFTYHLVRVYTSDEGSDFQNRSARKRGSIALGFGLSLAVAAILAPSGRSNSRWTPHDCKSIWFCSQSICCNSDTDASLHDSPNSITTCRRRPGSHSRIRLGSWRGSNFHWSIPHPSAIRGLGLSSRSFIQSFGRIFSSRLSTDASSGLGSEHNDIALTHGKLHAVPSLRKRRSLAPPLIPL